MDEIKKKLVASLCALYEFFSRPLCLFGCDGALADKAILKETGLPRTGKDAILKTTKAIVRKATAILTFPSALILSLALCNASHSYAQTSALPDAPAKVAALHEGAAPGASSAAAPDVAPTRPAVAPDPASTADIAKELAAMKARIEFLEAELKNRAPAPDTPLLAVAPGGMVAVASVTAPTALPAQAMAAQPSSDLSAAPAKKEKIAPFSDWDWTWLNGNPRNKDTAFDSKFFTPEIRADVTYTYDFNKPIDDSMGGSSELFRSNEIQLEQLGVGGDFHYDNVRARLMTQFGMYSTATVRNDPSYSKGQWNIADADRYLAEAYGGYHLNALNGINIDAGIFMSYVGLFSYYNFDNWAYQPSYVSSNTPWFFTGMRAQFFPTNKLKIEPWLINGWQTYAKYNGREALGGQILWRPTANLDFVWNTYTLGRDTLGNDNRSRYHEDDSQEYKYYENPNKFMHRAAFTLTEDIGCESGGGVVCKSGNSQTPAQNFMGIMGYNRWWFDKDRFAFEVGGGVMNNPGRYLVLLPPINGASATSGTPYFTQNPGQPFKAYDFQIGADFFPSQWVTWHVEFTQRGSNVPYFAGPGGITPQTTPGLYVNSGPPGSFVPGFAPDLVKQERRWILSLMVKL